MAQLQPDNNPTRLASYAPQAALFGGVFSLVFALYIYTLAPGVVGGDAGEHQFAVPMLGIPHTTGYPLYLLLGKLWTLIIPFGSMAWRMNLFSAWWGALAAATTALVVYAITGDIFATAKRPVWVGALVAGIALAYQLTLWQWSVIAGVRSLNVFFFALLTLEATLWAQQRQQGRHPTAEHSLRWLALTVGLSLAHHRTTIFYLPALVGWIGWHDRPLMRQPKRILSLALLALAPLGLYGFIYWRGLNNPPYTHEPIYNLQSFWFLVGSGDSNGLFFSIDPAYLPARLQFIWADALTQLAWPGVVLAVIGTIFLAIRSPKYLLFHGLLVLLLLLFTLDFEVVNLNEAPAWYWMPAYFIFAVWGGIGINGLYRFTIYDLRFTIYHLPFTMGAGKVAFLVQAGVALILLAVFTASLGRPNWQKQQADATAPLDDWRQLLRGEQAQRLVDSSLPYVAPNSIIWGDWEQFTPFKYNQFINGRRPDITVRLPLDLWPEKVAAAHAAGQPVYFSRKPTDLIGTRYLSMAGPLIFLGTAAQFNPPDDITLLNANFENELELIGYRAQVWPQGDAPILQLTLYWRVPHEVTWDYALSLRLIDAAGQEIFKKDATHPVLSSYPTTLWTPGEVVGDFYELPLPASNGPLTLHLLPYRTEGPGVWHNLTLTASNQPPENAPPEGILLGPFGE